VFSYTCRYSTVPRQRHIGDKCLNADMDNHSSFFMFKNQARPQMAEGQLWACSWFTEIFFWKVCVFVCVCVCTFVYLYACMYVCMSFHTHEQSFRSQKQPLYEKWRPYIELASNLLAGELWLKAGNTYWFEIRVERVWWTGMKVFPKWH